MEQLELLKRLIATPSTTGSEQEVSAILKADMESHGYKPECIGLNLLCYGHSYDPAKPTILPYYSAQQPYGYRKAGCRLDKGSVHSYR